MPGGQDTKGERTRKRLLDAAATEVARHGVARASLHAIAAAAELKTGSIYFHFGSKDELIEAMLEEGLRATHECLDTAIASVNEGAGPADRLAAAIRAHATAVHELSDYTLVVLSSATPEGGADAFRKLRRDYVERWTVIVTDAQAARVLPGDVAPRLVRDLIFGALNAVSLAGTPPGRAAEAVQALLRLPKS
ncbi:TetR/AcrR family transcriptional regulator [Pseudonocardia spinosispora]|uniref:TetR/AcrR family transcriptional regulator n=1 Tax=Pseudonocardia spinosispora TaxID=103441 RepID=UPI0003F82D91|nr:TetR/AcrR family transcriptional regulator [Pseudonocardia spinosispora]